MTNVDLPQRPVELGDVLSLHEELHLIYRSFDSLYEFVEYHLVSKDAVVVAPLVCIIRDTGNTHLYLHPTGILSNKIRLINSTGRLNSYV